MKMVAAAKLKRAQDRVTASRPFAGKMSEVLGNLSSAAGDFSHPLLDERGDSKYLIVLISADKGLAGAFNANVIKATQAFLKENDGKVDEMMHSRKAAIFLNVARPNSPMNTWLTGRDRSTPIPYHCPQIIETFTTDARSKSVYRFLPSLRRTYAEACHTALLR